MSRREVIASSPELTSQSKVLGALVRYLGSEHPTKSEQQLLEMSLEALGVDSFALIELTLYLEQQFGYSFPLSELTLENTRSVRKFGDTFSQLLLAESSSQS